MTDPVLPEVPDATPLDELASALLDGEATAAEEARRAEPSVARRIEAFGAVARLVGTAPEPVADEAREGALAAALALFDAAPAADAEPAPPADELAARRERRGAPRWLPAAAAAVLAAVGLGAVATGLGGRGDDIETADAAREAPSEAFTSIAGDAGETEAGGAPLFESIELGTFATVDELLAALPAPLADRSDDAGPVDAAGGSAGAGGGDTVASPPAAALPEELTACPPPPGAQAFDATLAGQPVLVWATDDTVTVVDPASCTPLADPYDR